MQLSYVCGRNGYPGQPCIYMSLNLCKWVEYTNIFIVLWWTSWHQRSPQVMSSVYELKQQQKFIAYFVFILEACVCFYFKYLHHYLQVHFAPHHQNKLVSASVDGLICIVDTDGDIDDDSLESVSAEL